MPVLASDPYRAYSYSTTDEGTLDVAAPQAYLPEKVLSASQLGVTVKSPEDLLFDAQGNLYICDTGSDAIHVFTPELKWSRSISSFFRDGEEDTFSMPYGIFVTGDGRL